MKNLSLNNAGFEYLEAGFKEWLDILGYCNQNVYNMPNIIREFFYQLEKHGVDNIHQLEQIHIKKYHEYISSRPNQRRGGGLSEKYILMHMQAIEKLLEYLHHRGIQNLPTLGIRLSQPKRKEIIILSVEEVQHLFELTRKEKEQNPNNHRYNQLQEIIDSRDRVMLVIYYSCGLRRNEGIHVTLDDINLDTKILHVRKGKKYKERFVPFNKTNAKILEEYICDYRPQIVKSKTESALFISANNGKTMQSDSLYDRLKSLQSQSDDLNLKEKEIGLHTLRHSIATHLLQAGMSLEKIARFLGHSTMDSTQIYTHLVQQDTTLSS